MCQHRYKLMNTRIFGISTTHTKKQVTTEFYECEDCQHKTSTRIEMTVNKIEVPPLTILDNMN